MQATFAERAAEEWTELIREAGVPCGPVNSLSEVFSDPHTLSSGMLREVEHPAAGIVRMLASPLLVDGERPGIRRPPPSLGEHTGELDEGGWLP